MEVDHLEDSLDFIRDQWGKFWEDQDVGLQISRALKSYSFRRSLDDYIDYHYEEIYDVAERKPTAIEMQQEIIRQVESDFSTYCAPIFCGELMWVDDGTETGSYEEVPTDSGRFTKVPLTNLVEAVFLEVTNLQETSCFWFESVEDFWEDVSQGIFRDFFYYCVIQLFQERGRKS